MTGSYARRGSGKVQTWGRACRAAIAGAALLMTGAAWGANGPELWVYNQTNLATTANTTATKGLIDRAAAAGYTYMVVADTKLSYDGDTSINNLWDPNWAYYNNIRSVISYGKSKGVTVIPSSFDLGRAEDWMLNRVNQNFAEGQQVKGANFTVAADGKSLLFNPQNPSVTNTTFTSGATGWSLDAGRAAIDTTTGRTDSASLKVAAGGGRGFGIQNITVQPNRQYHVTYWAKTQNFSGEMLVKMYDATAGRFRESHEGNSALSCTANQAWKQYDYVFNSGSSTSLQFRLGSWGGTSGTMWFDDVKVEEIALHNVVRSNSSPLKVYNGGTVYTEGTDFNPIQDPFSKQTGMTYRLYKTPLTPTLPTGTGLTPGQAVKIDYDAVQPVYQDQYGASLTEQGVKDYYARVITELRKDFNVGTGPMPGYMLGGYDELRHGASSTGAKATGKTGGELLAEHFKAAYDLVRAQDPTAPVITWSDLFDPNHNAKDKFYLWDSTLAGSWNGLPDDVLIMNWMRTRQSLSFFSGLGNPQIISGYYDVANGETQAWSEVQQAIDANGQLIPGVRGLMYTPWASDFTVRFAELEDYAKGAKDAWAALVPVPEPAALSVLLLALPLLLRRRRA